MVCSCDPACIVMFSCAIQYSCDKEQLLQLKQELSQVKDQLTMSKDENRELQSKLDMFQTDVSVR